MTKTINEDTPLSRLIHNHIFIGGDLQMLAELLLRLRDRHGDNQDCWFVSDSLAKSLKVVGEVVKSSGEHHLWLRNSENLRLDEDLVLQKIAKIIIQ